MIERVCRCGNRLFMCYHIFLHVLLQTLCNCNYIFQITICNCNLAICTRMSSNYFGMSHPVQYDPYGTDAHPRIYIKPDSCF